jgi:hypothetical protein
MKKTAKLTYQDYPKEPVVIDNLSIKFMKQSRFVPLELVDNTLKIAMADPDDFNTVDALKLAYGMDIEVLRRCPVKISLKPLNGFTGPEASLWKPLLKRPERIFMKST